MHLHLVDDLIYAEAGRPLIWRILLEGREELRYQRRPDEQGALNCDEVERPRDARRSA
jgi:hypothetical protein